MIFTPQKTVTSTLYDACADGCDIVQSKLGGVWCRVAIAQGVGVVYNQLGDVLHTFTTIKSTASVLIGNFFGPPVNPGFLTLCLWDCWAIEVAGEVEDLHKVSYRNRFAYLKTEMSVLSHSYIELGKNYPIAYAKDLWANEHNTGLVFRRSRDPVNVSLRVARKYANVPTELE